MYKNSFNTISCVKALSRQNSSTVRHGLLFVSLISPVTANNVRMSAIDTQFDRKLAIKQSYILLTWFYYLTSLEVRKNLNNIKHSVGFFAAPVRRRIFTLTKAPMAHKTWSKEQFKFQYRTFRISFNSTIADSGSISSLNEGLLFMLLGKKIFPNFETNLLFLKSCTILAHVSDINFFNYYKFIRARV